MSTPTATLTLPARRELYFADTGPANAARAKLEGQGYVVRSEVLPEFRGHENVIRLTADLAPEPAPAPAPRKRKGKKARDSFEQWMVKVSAAIGKKAGGLDADDLPDFCYRDAYDDGSTPAQAARAAIKAA
jgi:hypothetical protein